MLNRHDVKPKLLVRTGFADHGEYSRMNVDIEPVDHGETGDNAVHLTENSAADVDRITDQFRTLLQDSTCVLTHDLIYQPNMWKCHVAARRVARERPNLRWLHWVHSSTDMGVSGQVGRFRGELSGTFPNSELVVFHGEELNRKGSLYGYERGQCVIIPNPLDLTEGFHPVAQKVIDQAGLMLSDCVIVYPIRLDRGKQPHIVIEIASELAVMGYTPNVVIVDFHSTAGDKATYRAELAKMAQDTNVKLFFTSSLEGGEPGYPYAYAIPTRASQDLMLMADVFIHPSTSECDSTILAEAMWSRAGLILNFDLPAFRQHDGQALFYKFSSSIDTNTGMPGNTQTQYGNRREYMRRVAAGVAWQLENNPVLNRRVWLRKTKSLEAVWKPFWAAVGR